MTFYLKYTIMGEIAWKILKQEGHDGPEALTWTEWDMMLQTKYKNSGPSGFWEEDFQSLHFQTPFYGPMT